MGEYIKAFFRDLVSKNKFGHRYLNDLAFQTKVVLYRGLGIHLLYASFYLLTSWIYGSFWFGAVALYYMVFSVVRFILLKRNRAIFRLADKKERHTHELRTYRFCGCLLFAINIVMIGIIIQMIWKNKSYNYSRSVIYIAATYTFYNIIVAGINMVKFHRRDRPLLSAAKMLGFASALMSILALQTAMIAQFGGQDSFRRLMDGVTGGAIFLIVFGMALFMIIRANIQLKKIATLDENG